MNELKIVHEKTKKPLFECYTALAINNYDVEASINFIQKGKLEDGPIDRTLRETITK